MMTLAYIESILNQAGRFSTLEKLYPNMDSAGNPIFTTTSRTIIFDVTYNGKVYKLTVLNNYSESEKELIRQACYIQTIRAIKELMPAMYYEKELLVFDENGTAFKQDVILQRCEGTTDINTYIRCNLFLDNKQPIRDALNAISSLADNLVSKNIVHGGISARMLRFTNQTPTSAMLLDSPLIIKKQQYKDLKVLAVTAITLYLIGSRPNLYAQLGSQKMLNPEHLTQHYKYIISAAQFHGNKSLEGVLDSMHTKDSKLIAMAIKRLSETPFDSTFTLLEKLVDEYRERYRRNEYRITAAVNKESNDIHKKDTTIKVDWGKCSFIGEVCHNLVRFKYGEEWGYADREANRLPVYGLIDAEDFYEDRAVVKTADGFGLIDSSGKYIIKPGFEDMVWMGKYNIVSALHLGTWKLYDRCGNCLSETGYEQMGECCEGLVFVGKNNRYGFINKNGDVTIPLIYDEVFDFEYGHATVVSKGKEITINKEGNRVK